MKAYFRYIVNNVDEAIKFYTGMLGFKTDFRAAPGFAALSKDDLVLYLNQPGFGGAGQTTPDGSVPSPGGWNRIQFQFDDLESVVKKLKDSKAKFKNEILTGQGGKQILLEDPSGNLIELFEPFKGS